MQRSVSVSLPHCLLFPVWLDDLGFPSGHLRIDVLVVLLTVDKLCDRSCLTLFSDPSIQREAIEAHARLTGIFLTLDVSIAACV